MIVSWNWLQQYVPLKMPVAEVEQRLMMAGLNHEQTDRWADDFAIDLEVTSNRPDCLGHLGVAREIGVLFDLPLCLPAAEPQATGQAAEEQLKVRIACPELCYRYTARIIRGVKIGSSPAWLADRLQAIGIGLVNNVVDVTNYVMFECGQPLHAFDLATLQGPEILVREATDKEAFEAIDHHTYQLEAGMCVIADSRRAVALGGVMGGAATEVSGETCDLLIEAAEFSPLSIRNTARKLNLHSPSSYRFERGIDPEGVDWASRRCCELILDLAGGELAEGVVDVGRDTPRRQPVVLRLEQLSRILGIDVPAAEVSRILATLGNEILADGETQIEVHPPSWRRDLTREIDLVEEVARIHGYEKIPEDVAVPMWPSHRSDRERVARRVQQLLTGAGFDEALTASLIPQEWSEAFSPWTQAEPIQSLTPMKGILADAPKDLGQADIIRRSLIPSLLESRRYNESVGNPSAELFEIAKVYLPHEDELPAEHWTLGIVSGGSFARIKGVVEDLLDALHISDSVETVPSEQRLFESSLASELQLAGKRLGFLGVVGDKGKRAFGLRADVVVAELRMSVLETAATLVPQYRPSSSYPPISRDLNLVVHDSLPWADLAKTAREAGGDLVETLDYQETYRDPERDGPSKKRLLFSLTLRSADRTLTNEEADEIRDRIVAACAKRHSAELLA